LRRDFPLDWAWACVSAYWVSLPSVVVEGVLVIATPNLAIPDNPMCSPILNFE